MPCENPVMSKNIRRGSPATTSNPTVANTRPIQIEKIVFGISSPPRPTNVAKAIRKFDVMLVHYLKGRLVCVENTSNRGGCTYYAQDALDSIAKVAHDNKCASHIDGARLFNAAIATSTNPARMVRDYDSISICLSKGLGAPVGSVLVGSREFINRAHHRRKTYGGGIQQAGNLAAAGYYALENNIKCYAAEHIRRYT